MPGRSGQTWSNTMCLIAGFKQSTRFAGSPVYRVRQPPLQSAHASAPAAGPAESGHHCPNGAQFKRPPPPPYLVDTPRPSPRTTRARRVPHPVLIGRIASSSSRPASLALALAFRRGGGGGGGGGGREGVYSRDTGRGNSREGGRSGRARTEGARGPARSAACPVSAGWGTRRVRLVRGEGRGVSV